MPYATAQDGTVLYYKDWGSGDPVVLLHGWPLSGDTFDDAALALVEAGKRCIIPDRRGFGRSDQPWNGHDYDTYADDVVAILEDAGINEPVALVGFSMGGGEVARFLTRQGAEPRLEGGADRLGRPLHAQDRRQSQRGAAGDLRRDDRRHEKGPRAFLHRLLQGFLRRRHAVLAGQRRSADEQPGARR